VHLKSIAIRYAGLVCSLGFIFGSVVACGAQFYKVSMEDDIVYVQAVEGVDDPSSPNFGLSQPSGWASLPIKFQVGIKLNTDQKMGLLKAMRTWEIAVGRKLFDFSGIHAGTEGDSFKDLMSSLDDYVNGHYLDFDWSKTGKKTRVLATTIWTSGSDGLEINTADIRFNGHNYNIGDAYTIFGDGDRDVVDMETLALHELGHLLGLAHIERTHDPDSIMVPEVYIGEGLTNRHLSSEDIKRIQRIYGCAGVACNVEETMSLLAKQQAGDEEKQFAIYQEAVVDGSLSAH
jgi:hypothetical protein